MTNEVKPHEVPPEDLTLYAMGALEGAELARIAKHVEDCASCRTELQRIHSDLGVYSMAAAPELMPPTRAKERLMAEIAKDMAPAKARSGWGWLLAYRIAVAVLLLVALGLEFKSGKSLREENAQLRQELSQEQAESAQARAIAETIRATDVMKVTLVAANTKPQPSAHAFYSRDKARVFLIATELAPLEKGKMYELWLLPKSWSPVPAGMFQSGADWNAHMMHSGLPKGMEAKGFAITIEPEEGSLAPSGQPILMGTTS